MGIIDSKKTYKTPQAKVLEVKVHGLLCSSDPKEIYTTEMEEGDDNW